MRFSVWLTGRQSWESMLAAARHVDATGWDGVYVADHFMGMEDDTIPTLEAWTTLTAIAASTAKVRVGTLVLGNTYRHPAVVAKMATTLDQVSGGRTILGLGAGWQENEHVEYGIELGPLGERLARLEEACQVITGLFGKQRTDFDGRYYRLQGATCEPKAVHGHLPLLIGGSGEKVSMRLAATYADEWNTWGDPATMAAKRPALDRHCEALGRDPSTIVRSAQANVYCRDDAAWIDANRGRMKPGRPTLVGTPAELVETMFAYAAAGVGEFIVPDFNVPSPSEKLALFDLLAEEVVAPVRTSIG